MSNENQLYTTLMLHTSCVYFIQVCHKNVFLIEFLKHHVSKACTARKDSMREVYNSITLKSKYNKNYTE